MLHRLAAVLALSLACAHDPSPGAASGPIDRRVELTRGDASAALEIRHQVESDRSVSLTAELSGGGSGSVGPVSVEVRSEAFTLEVDAPVWTAEVATGGRTRHTWRLRPRADGLATIDVLHGLAAGGKGEVTALHFRVTQGAVRRCASADCRDQP